MWESLDIQSDEELLEFQNLEHLLRYGCPRRSDSSNSTIDDFTSRLGIQWQGGRSYTAFERKMILLDVVVDKINRWKNRHHEDPYTVKLRELDKLPFFQELSQGHFSLGTMIYLNDPDNIRAIEIQYGFKPTGSKYKFMKQWHKKYKTKIRQLNAVAAVGDADLFFEILPTVDFGSIGHRGPDFKILYGELVDSIVQGGNMTIFNNAADIIKRYGGMGGPIGACIRYNRFEMFQRVLEASGCKFSSFRSGTNGFSKFTLELVANDRINFLNYLLEIDDINPDQIRACFGISVQYQIRDIFELLYPRPEIDEDVINNTLISFFNPTERGMRFFSSQTPETGAVPRPEDEHIMTVLFTDARVDDATLFIVARSLVARNDDVIWKILYTLRLTQGVIDGALSGSVKADNADVFTWAYPQATVDGLNGAFREVGSSNRWGQFFETLYSDDRITVDTLGAVMTYAIRGAPAIFYRIYERLGKVDPSTLSTCLAVAARAGNWDIFQLLYQNPDTPKKAEYYDVARGGSYEIIDFYLNVIEKGNSFSALLSFEDYISNHSDPKIIKLYLDAIDMTNETYRTRIAEFARTKDSAQLVLDILFEREDISYEIKMEILDIFNADSDPEDDDTRDDSSSDDETESENEETDDE